MKPQPRVVGSSITCGWQNHQNIVEWRFIELVILFVISYFENGLFRDVHITNLDTTTLVITTQMPALKHNRKETGFDWKAFGEKVKERGSLREDAIITPLVGKVEFSSAIGKVAMMVFDDTAPFLLMIYLM